MTDLTDMELLARIDLTRSALTEAETNVAIKKMDLEKLLAQLASRESKKENNLVRHMPKLTRIYNFILDFTNSAIPKKTASYRFVPVPQYRDPCGMSRPDPLEYRIDEENDIHITVTFFVSNDRLRNFVKGWWQTKFKNLAYVTHYPDDETAF